MCCVCRSKNGANNRHTHRGTKKRKDESEWEREREGKRSDDVALNVEKFPLKPLTTTTKIFILTHCFIATAKSRQWNIVISNRCQAQLSHSNECETEMSAFYFAQTATITITMRNQKMKKWWEIGINWFGSIICEIISWGTVDWFSSIVFIE